MIGRRKKKKAKIRVLSILIMMAGIAAVINNTAINPGNHENDKKEYGNNTTSYNALKATPNISDTRTTSSPATETKHPSFDSLSLDRLNSPNAILIRLTDQSILIQKNSEEKIYPASLTKMMTAIVAIENLPDLKEEIKLTNATFQGLYEAGASMAGFQPGEKVMAIDLLYGILLPSGAECCIGIADHIAGSEQEFVNMMNQKAADLGMEATHFENTTGLQDENHYTTVKDLAVLLSYALHNSTFKEIFTSSRHSISPTNKHPDGMTFYSTMFEKLNDKNINDGEILGGKTGYTTEAGLCLASLARVDKQEYILVSAGAKGNHRSEQYNITDALTVYNSMGE